MPLEQVNAGLVIQPLSEILDEYRTGFVDLFGEAVNTDPDSIYGMFTGLMSEREGLEQQLLQRIKVALTRGGAEDEDLDAIALIVGSTRQFVRAKSTAGRALGTGTVVIFNGSLVTNDITGVQWEIVDGLNGFYTISGGDVAPVTIRATIDGVQTFDVTDTWTIDTPVVDWDSFETTRDIDPTEVGRFETNDEYRARTRDDLFPEGNDLEEIRQNVVALDDTLEANVTVTENEDCTTAALGIPEGAFEVVVESGRTDTEIATAILEKKPPGAEAFGVTIVALTDLAGEGNSIDVGFTRITEIPIHLEMTINTNDAEGSLPIDFITLVKQTMLDFANANDAIGQDVLFQTFTAAVYPVLRDVVTGLYSAFTLTSKTSLDGITFFEVNRAISERERATYSLTNIDVLLAP